MAAYLLYKEYHLVDTYKEKKGVTLFIFEHDSFIDNHAMKFINNNGDICFWDFQEEILTIRLITERDG